MPFDSAGHRRQPILRLVAGTDTHATSRSDDADADARSSPSKWDGSNVIPWPAASSIISSRQRNGTRLPRLNHCRLAWSEAPNFLASAEIKMRRSSMTHEGDNLSLLSRPSCPLTSNPRRGTIWPMTARTRTQFNQAFAERTRQARAFTTLTQGEMATALGIELDAYKKYEQRSPMQQYLVQRFCLICGISVETFFDLDKPLLRRAS